MNYFLFIRQLKSSYNTLKLIVMIWKGWSGSNACLASVAIHPFPTSSLCICVWCLCGCTECFFFCLPHIPTACVCVCVCPAGVCHSPLRKPTGPPLSTHTEWEGGDGEVWRDLARERRGSEEEEGKEEGIGVLNGGFKIELKGWKEGEGC